MKIQVGANDGQTITIDLKKIDSTTLGLESFNVNGKGSVANTAASLKDMKGFTSATTTTTGVTKFTNTAATASSQDILAAVANGDTVQTSADVGLGAVAATFKYDSATNTYTAATVNAVDEADATAFLNPTAGDSTKASVSIGSKTQDVIIAKDGKITAADDNAVLYLDSAGNLTKNNAGGTATQATMSGLANATGGAAATITTDKGTLASAGTGKFNVTNAKVSGDTLTNSVKNGDYVATIGGNSFTVATGSATTPAYMNDGKLSSTPPTYYAQIDGSITTTEDASVGKAVYVTANGKLTTEQTTASEKTSDPLAALDTAISQIDKFRSSLGAVQNRLDSAVTNLNNTTTNLSEAQSRIQDADYATEVSNMSKAQIIQQAGNSVLAKANQVPQQVLSLLQG